MPMSNNAIRYIQVVPVPKPRMVKSDSWSKRPAVLRYWSFKDELKLKLPHYILPERLRIVFHVPMPPSWSTKKRLVMVGTPHQQKPDVDNYLKAFMDCSAEEDSYVWDVRVTKVWAKEGGITLYETMSN